MKMTIELNLTTTALRSAGAAVFWRLDAIKKPYNTIFGATVSFSPS